MMVIADDDDDLHENAATGGVAADTDVNGPVPLLWDDHVVKVENSRAEAVTVEAAVAVATSEVAASASAAAGGTVLVTNDGYSLGFLLQNQQNVIADGIDNSLAQQNVSICAGIVQDVVASCLDTASSCLSCDSHILLQRLARGAEKVEAQPQEHSSVVNTYTDTEAASASNVACHHGQSTVSSDSPVAGCAAASASSVASPVRGFGASVHPVAAASRHDENDTMPCVCDQHEQLLGPSHTFSSTQTPAVPDGGISSDFIKCCSDELIAESLMPPSWPSAIVSASSLPSAAAATPLEETNLSLRERMKKCDHACAAIVHLFHVQLFLVFVPPLTSAQVLK
jgi:hypothetical protein